MDGVVLGRPKRPSTDESQRGVRFDDPQFGIYWPMPPVEMSAKVREWPDYDPTGPDAAALRGCR